MVEHVYTAAVEWRRGEGEAFTDNRYGRGHLWTFDGGVSVPASSAPSSVRVPYSREDAVDPEEALVAALSSCHMLFFLSFAAKAGYVVDRYRDDASGTMAPNESGRLHLSRVTLAPAVAFSGESQPDAPAIEALHHAAHDHCYIANSVRAEIVIEPRTF
ncbi:OsmC family protein [Enterovirga rhinocerotis]|uniref:Organic hydroperoxide reductase OsmC/OhrA n=1 Tax=Enterovirga rhinocerotis TaxID=1339210 RepID=A0A4R7CCT1_9HYPH|nr:OsmC family protein [Enterovirga rhinocerotis]TDR94627.1 organic hydroperoxide reductase OsmC/OhrA [Enterovirga rhinocerotis]